MYRIIVIAVGRGVNRDRQALGRLGTLLLPVARGIRDESSNVEARMKEVEHAVGFGKHARYVEFDQMKADAHCRGRDLFRNRRALFVRHLDLHMIGVS